MTAQEKQELIEALNRVRNSDYITDECENGNYSSALEFLGELQKELETTPTEPVGPITIYAHEDGDDCECEVEQGLEAGLSHDIADEFAHSRPLYEVAFDFMVDPVTGKGTCVEIRGVGQGTYRDVTHAAPILIKAWEQSSFNVRPLIAQAMTILRMMPPREISHIAL